MGQCPVGLLYADISPIESRLVSGACNCNSSCSFAMSSAGMAWTNPLHCPEGGEEDVPKVTRGHFGLDAGDSTMQR